MGIDENWVIVVACMDAAICGVCLVWSAAVAKRRGCLRCSPGTMIFAVMAAGSIIGLTMYFLMPRAWPTQVFPLPGWIACGVLWMACHRQRERIDAASVLLGSAVGSFVGFIIGAIMMAALVR